MRNVHGAGARVLAGAAAVEAALVATADECAAAEGLICVQVTLAVLGAALAVLTCEMQARRIYGKRADRSEAGQS